MSGYELVNYDQHTLATLDNSIPRKVPSSSSSSSIPGAPNSSCVFADTVRKSIESDNTNIIHILLVKVLEVDCSLPIPLIRTIILPYYGIIQPCISWALVCTDIDDVVFAAMELLPVWKYSSDQVVCSHQHTSNVYPSWYQFTPKLDSSVLKDIEKLHVAMRIEHPCRPHVMVPWRPITTDVSLKDDKSAIQHKAGRRDDNDTIMYMRLYEFNQFQLIHLIGHDTPWTILSINIPTSNNDIDDHFMNNKLHDDGPTQGFVDEAGMYHDIIPYEVYDRVITFRQLAANTTGVHRIHSWSAEYLLY